MVLAGYFVGTMVEDYFNIKLQDHIEKVVVVVVFLSLLPPIIEFLKHKFGKHPDAVDEVLEVVEADGDAK
jgi:hypothetical protein